MLSNHKTFHFIFHGMMGLWLCLLCPATSFSENQDETPPVLLVGVIAAPPAYMKTTDGRWEGFAVELWQAVAEHIGTPMGGWIVALIWMIFSIIFIASITANITTSLTIAELRGKIRGFNDLYNARVGSVPRRKVSIF